MTFCIESNFFCIFKTGDNIVYNLRTINYLYEIYERGNDEQKKLLVKPIVILLAAIVEAILYDFHLRIRANRHEGITNLHDDVIAYIRGKNIDEFEKYIASARKHNLFDRQSESFYKKLDELRLVRNRIHIQNKKFLEPRDENLVFREEAKVLAEKCIEVVTGVMNKKYGRPMQTYVDQLSFPWDEHFSQTST